MVPPQVSSVRVSTLQNPFPPSTILLFTRKAKLWMAVFAKKNELLHPFQIRTEGGWQGSVRKCTLHLPVFYLICEETEDFGFQRCQSKHFPPAVNVLIQKIIIRAARAVYQKEKQHSTQSRENFLFTYIFLTAAFWKMGFSLGKIGPNPSCKVFIAQNFHWSKHTCIIYM